MNVFLLVTVVPRSRGQWMFTHLYGIKNHSAEVASNTPLSARVDNHQPTEPGRARPQPSGTEAGTRKLPDGLAPKGGTHWWLPEGTRLVRRGQYEYSGTPQSLFTSSLAYVIELSNLWVTAFQ